MSNILQLSSITRNYKQGETTLEVLRGIDLAVKKGEIIALVGASGSGKSTLLQIIGLLDNPTSGEVKLAGQDASRASDSVRTALRLQYLGFVYQFHNLLPEFSAVENIMIPQMIAGFSKKKAEERSRELLDMLGLAKRATHRPAELSGGEQQRVAIARALANNPSLLIADEPTGNLDPDTAENVFHILLESVRKQGLSAIIATHNMELANRMDRKLLLNQGKI